MTAMQLIETLLFVSMDSKTPVDKLHLHPSNGASIMVSKVPYNPSVNPALVECLARIDYDGTVLTYHRYSPSDIKIKLDSAPTVAPKDIDARIASVSQNSTDIDIPF